MSRCSSTVLVDGVTAEGSSFLKIHVARRYAASNNRGTELQQVERALHMAASAGAADDRAARGEEEAAGVLQEAHLVVAQDA